MIHVPEQKKSLTVEQKIFAESHHGLLVKYMGTHGLSEEYYGLLAERFVNTVKAYLESSKLQQYAFSTILWYRLSAELYKERRRQWRNPQNHELDNLPDNRARPEDTATAALLHNPEPEHHLHGVLAPSCRRVSPMFIGRKHQQEAICIGTNAPAVDISLPG